MSTEFFLLNIPVYLIALGCLVLILVLFWRFWCLDRVLVLGMFASSLVAVVCVAGGSLVLFQMRDPGIQVALINAGLIFP